MTDQNISQFKAEKQVIDFTVQDDDGNNIDLTSGDVQNVYFDVATGLAQYGETKFEKTASNLGADGSAKVTIDSTDTENFTPGNYLYELYVEFNNASNYTAEVGKFFVKPRVDR